MSEEQGFSTGFTNSFISLIIVIVQQCNRTAEQQFLRKQQLGKHSRKEDLFVFTAAQLLFCSTEQLGERHI
ncbi:MAG: hypothetical protein A2X59_06655 [Nitrospirae bacterium GWC2_42_7]|nr:MAG: hypothetical protein A2X59_06655 [Nitrospirae bacterium GWC2_42_7]